MTRMNCRLYVIFGFLVTGLMLMHTGCIKQEFDAPPINQIPVGEQVTIEDLYQLYQDEGTYTFTDDQSLYAVVTMDETTGNIYRSAFIQDATGGMNLHLLESGGLRVGDSIRVYLKNCILSTYNSLHQIDNVDNDSNIIILANQRYRTPERVTISQIQAGGYESHLVELDSVQFMQTELGKTYSDADASANRMLEDCDGNSLIVRTSNYATFATTEIPEGNGSIIGIISLYGADYQLYIRTLYEVALDGERCEGGGGGDVEPVDEINETFSSTTPDADIVLEKWLNINEVGDRKWQAKEYDGNTYAQASGYNSGLSEMIAWLITPPIRIQGTKFLTFSSAKAYWAHSSNDGLTVWISSDFNGTDVGSASWTQLEARIANQHDPDHEFIPSGNIDLSSYTGIYYIGFRYRGSSTESTSFRIDDVIVNSSGAGGGVTSMNEDFESQSNDVDISLSGWLNEATIGSRLWRAKEFDSNVYAQATSFNSNEENECWLITPPIDLDAMTSPKFTFESAQAYWTHDGLSVWISTDFNGVNIVGATWVELNPILAGQSDPEHDWIFSGVVDLSAYSGTAHIGFKYNGNGNTGLTSSYRIDNVQLYDE
ncbi:MAG: DUF5689 domain-containing protein [Bacteroidales bacterium]|nr:choice-of-anchor J domain-containing protein [Lentimicrobiaceae bacterium]MDD5693720.1 DUF5689 domain-containing protein [Bacteroidales bacterium]